MCLKLQQGGYKICVVANETAAMTASFDAAGKLSDLNAIQVVTPAMESQLVLYQSVDIMLRPVGFRFTAGGGIGQWGYYLGIASHSQCGVEESGSKNLVCH